MLSVSRFPLLPRALLEIQGGLLATSTLPSTPPPPSRRPMSSCALFPTLTQYTTQTTTVRTLSESTYVRL